MSNTETGWFAVFQQQLSAMPLLEAIAVALAVAYVLLAARQNIWCWLCAFVSTALYSYIFWEVNLRFQVGLNVYYVAMAVYGFYQWHNGGGSERPVTRMTRLQHALMFSGTAILTMISVNVVQTYTEGHFVFADAFITVASVLTTILVAHKKCENWLYWMAINAVACWLYWQVELYLTSILFFAYIGLAVYGWMQWQSEKRATE